MRVLIDGRPALGGVGRATRNLVAGLRESLPEDQLVVFGESRTGPIGLPRWRRVARAAGGGAKTVLTDQIALPAVVQRNSIDIFHSPRYLVPQRIGVPAVVTLYDFSLVDLFHNKKRGIMKYYERWAFLQALNRSQFIITPSDTVRREIMRRQNLKRSKIVRIYPSLTEVDRLTPPAAMPSNIPSKFLLSVGTLEPRKNIESLLDAHALMWQELRIPLLLVGPYGWLQRRVVRRIEASGETVRRLGWVDDRVLAELYRRATAVVQLSLLEGFDLPVAEALMCRAPVILSDIEIHHEVAGDCGIYTEAQAPSSPARAMAEVAGWSENRRAHHGDAAVQRIAELQREDPIARHLEVYRHTLASSRPARGVR